MNGEKLELCGALHESRVFAGYAYGDPLECYAEYINSDGEAEMGSENAAIIYVACQREANHLGKHLAHAHKPWSNQ